MDLLYATQDIIEMGEKQPNLTIGVLVSIVVVVLTIIFKVVFGGKKPAVSVHLNSTAFTVWSFTERLSSIFLSLLSLHSLLLSQCRRRRLLQDLLKPITKEAAAVRKKKKPRRMELQLPGQEDPGGTLRKGDEEILNGVG